ncbi:hypothetical protein PflCFBP13517_25605 [Pseudomonas fluorescens]|nr:hypothetical protein PflCFBP13517_25605 [Pseudomonas fluorescens]
MSRVVDLRCIDELEYNRRQAMARWQRCGHSVHLHQLDPQTTYITFRAQSPEGVWQGLVGAQDWFHAVWPRWKQLLPQGCSSSEILDIFLSVNRPLQITSSLLDYQYLFDVELIQGELWQQVQLPCISTAQGQLWVAELPPRHKSGSLPLQQVLLTIPQSLRVVLGFSELHQGQLSQLIPGDVLFISKQTQELFMAEKYVGQFTFISEGLHMQLTSFENTDSGEVCAVSKLPMRLEFVLGELTLPIAQLNDFIEYQVLPIETIDLKQVEIRAGGQRIAIGELVRLDGQLGVELREVFRGVGNE